MIAVVSAASSAALTAFADFVSVRRSSTYRHIKGLGPKLSV
jgi:hypothetical protein